MGLFDVFKNNDNSEGGEYDCRKLRHFRTGLARTRQILDKNLTNT